MVKRYVLGNVGSCDKLIRPVTKGISSTGHYCVSHVDLFSLQHQTTLTTVEKNYRRGSCILLLAAYRFASSLCSTAEHNRCLVNHHVRPLQAKRAEQVAPVSLGDLRYFRDFLCFIRR